MSFDIDGDARMSDEYSAVSSDGGFSFNRSVDGFSRSTIDRAAAAKYRLEHFYKLQVSESADREARYAMMSYGKEDAKKFTC